MIKYQNDKLILTKINILMKGPKNTFHDEGSGNSTKYKDRAVSKRRKNWILYNNVESLMQLDTNWFSPHSKQVSKVDG